MDADHVARAVEIVEFHEFNTGLRFGVHGPGDDTHPDAGGYAGKPAADGSQADNAAGFAVELDGLAARPLAPARGRVQLRDAARNGQQQGQRMFGDGNGRDSGGAGHGDAVAGGGRQVHVVGAGAPHGDEAQVRTGGEDALRELGRRADVQNHLGRADSFDEAVCGGGEGIVVVEGGAGGELGPYGAGAQDGGSVVGDGDLRHLHSIVAKAPPPSCIALAVSAMMDWFRVYSFLLLATTRL